jgi:acyl dehydratase
MYADHFLPENGLHGPGIDELRWHMPVRPGDVLSMRVTIQDKRVSRSRPDRGIVHILSEVLKENGEVVLSAKPINLIRLRGAA